MKTIITKKIGFYLLVLFAVVACDDKDEEAATPDPTVSASCRITQIADDDEEVSKIEYNNAGYITKVTETDEDDEVYTTTFIYDANNRLIKEENREDGDLDDYRTFAYTNNLVTSSTYYDVEDGSEYTTTYKYDANNRKIEETDEDDYKNTYTYDANGNISKIESFYNNVVSYRQIFENYDNKPSYYSALKGLPSVYFDASKNNPGKTTYYSDRDGNGTIDATPNDVIDYTYKYNSNGFPTEIKETSGTDTYTTTLTYQCN